MSRPSDLELARTERIIRDLTAGRPVTPADAVFAMLTAWREELLSGPIPEGPTTGEVIAALRAGTEAMSRGSGVADGMGQTAATCSPGATNGPDSGPAKHEDQTPLERARCGGHVGSRPAAEVDHGVS